MRDVVLRVVDFLENYRVNPRYDELGYRIIEFIIACHVLKIIGDTVAIPTLVDLLKKYGENRYLSDRYRMKAAADALIGFGAEAVQPLMELLKSDYYETRKFAAYLLGKIGDRKGFHALVEALNDSGGLVREAVGRAMLHIDHEKAAEIIKPDSLTPAENPRSKFSRLTIERSLDTIEQCYGSLDGLGPPSEYKFSVSLFDYIEEVAHPFYKRRDAFRDYFDSEEDDDFKELATRLGLPQELVDEIVKMDNHFLLCMCGEYLKWGYVYSISKRVYEIEDYEGWHFMTRDVICAYCTNCKRYTSLTRKTDSAHPGYKDFVWFYLPRLPKQSELVDEKKLEEKEPILIKWNRSED